MPHEVTEGAGGLHKTPAVILRLQSSFLPLIPFPQRPDRKVRPSRRTVSQNVPGERNPFANLFHSRTLEANNSERYRKPFENRRSSD